MSNFQLIKKLPKSYWVANIMELFERWAYYGLFAVLALYLTQSKESGALGFTQGEKGILMGTVAGVLYFLPVITGALADRFGYKRTLVIAYIILCSGYFFMGQVTDYTAFFLIFLYTAIGAALFKPVISATIARTTNDATASIGFGIFYMIVNIGAFIGPVFAAKLRVISWNYVFMVSSGIILINILILLLFFKIPERVKNEDSFFYSIKKALLNIVSVIFDFRFLFFLLIIIGFWAMYFQLFYSLPVFIDQWIDTGVIYNAFESLSPSLAQFLGTKTETIAPEMIISIDTMYIIIFQLLVSTYVIRFKPLKTMIGGIFLASVGLAFWFVTRNGLFLFGSILLFALGEMACSPKITQYIGKIAPADKTALYMGTSFIPLAGGNFLAGFLSGDVYTQIADKTYLLKQYLYSHNINIRCTDGELFDKACTQLNVNHQQLTDILWNTQHPWIIFIVYSGIGFITALVLFLYDKFILSKPINK